MKKLWQENSLALTFGVLFIGALVAQAIAGHDAFNNDQLQHGGTPISLAEYVVSSTYGAAVLENWQSEYLQFTLFIFFTVWLVQRGSPESKELHKKGGESDEDQKLGRWSSPKSPKWARAKGVKRKVYENSLVLVMGFIWLASWFGQSVTGWTEYSDELIEHQQDPLTWAAYLGSADFWERTFQNWQSEFLAVGSMAILAVYLRQRGSPESKPVGAPHEATGAQG